MTNKKYEYYFLHELFDVTRFVNIVQGTCDAENTEADNRFPKERETSTAEEVTDELTSPLNSKRVIIL